MSFGEDEEILQDFLVEAGEILELLSEQLVDLEQKPDDKDLLNAIFRGFHTVKGGAGFLQLNALVDCCHVTENLFDHLRNGKISVTPELMDVTLQALDAVNEMFAQVQSREDLTPADPALIEKLASIVDSAEQTAVPVPDAGEGSVEPQTEEHAEGSGEAISEEESDDGDLSDSEFELFLDAIQEPAANKQASGSEIPTAQGDEIGEDEFEALLDQLHGKGKHGGAVMPEKGEALNEPAVEVQADAATQKESAQDSDEITEDEFEALLDQLHGKSAPGAASSTKEPGKDSPSKDKQDAATGDAGDDLITDDEFESLLDQLHGSGKAPAASDKSAAKPALTQAAQDTEPKAPPSKDAAAKTVAAKDKIAKTADSNDKASPAKPAAKVKVPVKKTDAAPASAETTVRVDTQRLDEIMNMVGELVLVRNRLVRLGLKSGDEEMGKAVANLDLVTADLQSSVMKTRMQPIKKVFGRFPRVVRDLARNLKKEITLELQGEDTDLDKNLVEALADPLVHLVRNSVDHGIEMPADREKAGKPRVGKVVLAAEQEGDHILLSITDDGAGMDPEKLRNIAISKGLYDEDSAARLSDSDCFNLIFAPGFSTKKEISDVSGRGVGMDVVKTKINQLNGSIEIRSKIGEGSQIIIKVPLTLAIMPTLMVMLGHQAFALPLVSVNEIFHMDLTRTNVVDGQEVVIVRDKALPLFYLRRWLVADHESIKSEAAHVVIVSVGTQRVGFVVDQLIGQEEVVIKPLGKMLQGTPGMAGATITGDGRIALILDVPSMLKRYAG
jgi:two-component system chemotaxis sensor kinase CheA